jgi:hypothetical protein
MTGLVDNGDHNPAQVEEAWEPKHQTKPNTEKRNKTSNTTEREADARQPDCHNAEGMP